MAKIPVLVAAMLLAAMLSLALHNSSARPHLRSMRFQSIRS